MVLVLTQDNNAAKTAATGGQSSNGGKSNGIPMVDL